MEQAAAPAQGSPLCDIFTSPEAELARSILITKHLHADARNALFEAGAGTAVLAAAKRATVTIRLDDGRHGEVLPSHAIVRRAESAMSDLRTRAPLRTKVELVLITANMSDPWPLALALTTMQQGMAHVHELSMTHPGTLPTSLLLTAGKYCPNLRTLYVSKLEAMPSTHHLPHLARLTIRKPVALESVRPYLLQITHLSIMASELVVSLFTPPLVSSSLRTLSLERATLNDTLLQHLLESAPALEKLYVGRILLETATHADAQCKWRRLECWPDMPSSSMACLPLPTGMALIAQRFILDTCTAEEEALAIAAITRARERIVTFDFEQIHLDSGDMDVHEEPDAIRRQLNVLASLGEQAGTVNLNLNGWTLSAPLMQALQETAPGSCGFLLLNKVNWLPEPMSYAAFMRLLPRSCTCINIDNTDQLPPAQLESLLLGCPVDRTADHPLEVWLRFNGKEAVLAAEAIVEKMEQLGLYRHVVVELRD